MPKHPLHSPLESPRTSKAGQSGSSSALSLPDTGRKQMQASCTVQVLLTCSSHPASFVPWGNSHFITPSTLPLLPPSLQGFPLSCPTPHHTSLPTSLPRRNAPPPQPPHQAWCPPSPAPAAAGPQWQAERAGPPRLWLRGTRVPSLAVCLASSTRDMNHQPRQLRLLKYIFYRIPCTRHGGLAVFVCSTLRFLPHPDVLYLQLVAHLTWQADVGLQVPELASGQKSLV